MRSLVRIHTRSRSIYTVESLRHGEENEAYLLREDILLRTQGLSGIKPERTRASTPPPTIVDALVESVANEGSPQSARQRSQRP